MGLWLGIFVCAAGSAISAENAPDPPPGLEILPSRKANKFLIHNVSPDYPPLARINYIEGRVSIQAFVNDSGEVKEAHVLKGHPFLAGAALNAIRNWLFKPARARQGPPNFLTYVDVRFSLHTRKLTPFPERPEADLNRQVLPPEVAEQLPRPVTGRSVHLRILVGPDGRAMDAYSSDASNHDLKDAREVVMNWTFRPARWGAIAVPWYLEVDVPVGEEQPSLSGKSIPDPLLEPAKTR